MFKRYEETPMSPATLKALGFDQDDDAPKGSSAVNHWFHPHLDIFFISAPSPKEFIEQVQEHARNEIREKAMKALHSI